MSWPEEWPIAVATSSRLRPSWMSREAKLWRRSYGATVVLLRVRPRLVASRKNPARVAAGFQTRLRQLFQLRNPPVWEGATSSSSLGTSGRAAAMSKASGATISTARRAPVLVDLSSPQVRSRRRLDCLLRVR